MDVWMLGPLPALPSKCLRANHHVNREPKAMKRRRPRSRRARCSNRPKAMPPSQSQKQRECQRQTGAGESCVDFWRRMLVYIGFSTFELYMENSKHCRHMQAPGSTVLYTELGIVALHLFLQHGAFSRSVHMVETSVQAQLRPLGWLWMLGLMLFWKYLPPAAKKAVFQLFQWTRFFSKG